MILLEAQDVLAHTQIKDGFQRMSLPIVFILLLLCRLVICYQENVREKRELKKKEELQAAKTEKESENTEQIDSKEDKKTK